jgi:hypothetical protein
MGLVIKDKVELFMRLIEGDFLDYTAGRYSSALTWSSIEPIFSMVPFK